MMWKMMLNWLIYHRDYSIAEYIIILFVSPEVQKVSCSIDCANVVKCRVRRANCVRQSWVVIVADGTQTSTDGDQPREQTYTSPCHHQHICCH